MEAIIQFFNDALNFFNDVGTFFTNLWTWLEVEIYQFFTEWFATYVIWATVAMMKFKLFMIGFAWDVAQNILTQLNISNLLSNAWSQLDSDLLDALTFFNIPDAINIILSARVTRFVLNFMGL